MSTTPHEFVSVDMRGLKPALLARAQAERTTVSAVVRAAVAAHVGLEAPGRAPPAAPPPVAALVKVSLRFTRFEADQIGAAARSAGLSKAAYLAGLVAGIPALNADGALRDQRAALTASNAQLSSAVRSIRLLTSSMGQGTSEAAIERLEMLHELVDDVRRHLRLAGAVLTSLRPRAPRPGPEPLGESRHGARR